MLATRYWAVSLSHRLIRIQEGSPQIGAETQFKERVGWQKTVMALADKNARIL